MNIHKIIVGPLETNCYIIVDERTKKSVIIDPGAESEKIIGVVEKNGLKPEAIILTHAHPDHTGALEEVKSHFQIPISQGRTLVNLVEIRMPGHTPDSVCFVDEKGGNIFTGDTLFKNSIGRTDLGGGDYEQIQESLKLLLKYPDHFKIHPGHGPDSTIGEEKRNNPFL